jgi:P-type Ca2+ transporter type 2C
MWSSKSKEEVLKAFNVDPLQGLSEEEVNAGLEKYGTNKLLGKKKKSIFLLFISQLKDWLIYILLVAVVITLFLGEYVDAIIIVLVIIINSVLGVIQQVKADKAITLR